MASYSKWLCAERDWLACKRILQGPYHGARFEVAPRSEGQPQPAPMTKETLNTFVTFNA